MQALWRIDPKESLADWQIEIHYQREDGNPTFDSYFVHRCYLATGYQKSEFFKRMFAPGGPFVASVDFKSTFKMHHIAASAFPYLLDFLYLPNMELAVLPETVVALYFLGEFFQIPSLTAKAAQVLEKEFRNPQKTVLRWETYYKHALALDTTKIQTMFYDGVMNILKFSNKCVPRLNYVERPAWIKVFKHFAVSDEKFTLSRRMSVYVANFLADSSLSREDFSTIVSKDTLPLINPRYVKEFLEAEGRFDPDMDKTTISCLQKRCIEAMCWSTTQGYSPSCMDASFLQQQSPVFLAELSMTMHRGWTLKNMEPRIVHPSSGRKKRRIDSEVVEIEDS